MVYDKHSRMEWYIQHRLEHFRERRERLKSHLNDVDAAEEVDFDVWREFLELTGRIRELEHLLSSMDTW
jgi:hypothetical protein